MKTPRSWLRRISLLEGVSYLVLLGIAMPLKYAAGNPLPVKIAGWIHGALFVALCGILLAVMLRRSWTLGRGALIFGAALLPFGPFLVDRRIERFESGGP